MAAAAGQGALIAVLLGKGADPDALTGPSRITWVTEANFGLPPPPVPPTPPLLIAAQAGQAEAMRMLVAGGAEAGFVDSNGRNVVLAAATAQSLDALAYALELAPDVNVADAGKATALHHLLGGAFHPGLEPMLRLLASRGARIDLADADGRTAAALVEGGLSTVRAVFQHVFMGKPASGLALSGR